MEVSGLNITNVIDSTPKVKPNASKDTQDFNSVLNKATSRNTTAKNQVHDKMDGFKSSDDATDKGMDDSKPISQEVKDSLKKAGMSDEEIKSIKSVKDLKNVLTEKIMKGDSDGKVDLSQLLAILLSFLNGNIDVSKLQNILDKKIKDVVCESISKFSDLKPTEKNINEFMLNLNKDLKNMFKDNSDLLKLMNLNDNVTSDILKDIMPDIKSALSSMPMLKDNKVGIDDILSKIQSELASALKESLSDLKVQDSKVKSSADDILDALKFNVKNSSEVVKAVDSQSQNKDSGSLLKGNGNNEEENFLKSLVSDKDNSKISKVTNFMSQFNNVNVNENAGISQVENIVVNKNNFSADMIKALKYMEANNMKDLTVKIAPKELGEVVIRLTMESGVMKANITAANKDAYNLLNSNLQDITGKLQNNEVKIQSLTLNIYNEDTTFFKDESQRGQGNNNSKNKKSDHVDTLKEENGVVNNESFVDNSVNMLA